MYNYSRKRWASRYNNFKPQNVSDPNNIDEVDKTYSYRVALFRDIQTDAMHWTRQNADGTWSHKLGYLNSITNLDATGNIIYSPLN